jgi:hypothetical protein
MNNGVSILLCVARTIYASSTKVGIEFLSMMSVDYELMLVYYDN